MNQRDEILSEVYRLMDEQIESPGSEYAPQGASDSGERRQRIHELLEQIGRGEAKG